MAKPLEITKTKTTKTTTRTPKTTTRTTTKRNCLVDLFSSDRKTSEKTRSPTTPLTKKTWILGMFWQVFGRFGKGLGKFLGGLGEVVGRFLEVFWEVFWEVFGSCCLRFLGGFRRENSYEKLFKKLK